MLLLYRFIPTNPVGHCHMRSARQVLGSILGKTVRGWDLLQFRVAPLWT
jgi:hypothetical protein